MTSWGEEIIGDWLGLLLIGYKFGLLAFLLVMVVFNLYDMALLDFCVFLVHGSCCYFV